MKPYELLLFLLFLFYQSFCQEINPDISARVDTTNKVTNQIYHLYKNYLNSKPDSIYANPYWNPAEYNYYLKNNLLRIDRSANIMFYDEKADDFYKRYKPMVLQIDSIGENKYQIKTIFFFVADAKINRSYSVPYITNIYASKIFDGTFKLENTIEERTKDWRKVKYDFITYIIHPKCTFNKREAKAAVAFCKTIGRQFHISITPFTYYVLPNSDELGKIYNFEYWTYYISAQTNLPLREIFTSRGNTNYPHEFVHMIFPLRTSGTPPKIITEGLATWLGGPILGETFEEGLKEVSKTLNKQKTIVSFDDIKDGIIRNKFDDKILYITGAVICKLAYEKKGAEAIWQLYNATDNNLNKIIKNVFEEPVQNVKQRIVTFILDSY